MSREPKPFEVFTKPRHPRYNWDAHNEKQHEASVIGVLPYRQTRTRCPPCVEDLGVGTGMRADPLQEVEDQVLHGVGHGFPYEKWLVGRLPQDSRTEDNRRRRNRRQIPIGRAREVRRCSRGTKRIGALD